MVYYKVLVIWKITTFYRIDKTFLEIMLPEVLSFQQNFLNNVPTKCSTSWNENGWFKRVYFSDKAFQNNGRWHGNHAINSQMLLAHLDEFARSDQVMFFNLNRKFPVGALPDSMSPS